MRAFVRRDALEPGPVHIAPPEPGETRPWSRRPIASPLSSYPNYEVRTVGQPGWVGSVVVEVESEDGLVGVGVSVGGVAACWIVEQHLAQFVLGQPVSAVATIWDLMWRGSQFYGRRGVVLHAISAIDLALWDLAGKLAARPVYELLGGAARDQLNFYATTPDAAAARALGFLGCKIPLTHGLAAGRAGMLDNVAEFARAREAAGEEMLLALDCWMSLDVETAVELAGALEPYRPAWLEECLMPDDYWGHRRLRERFPSSIAVAGGEHEGTRWGFRALTELGGCDLLQPDPTWCGGMSELVRIVEDAEVGSRRVVTHGASAYGFHLAFARASIPFAECIMTSPAGDEIVPFFGDLFVAEPLPSGGTMDLTALAAPGFGLELNPAVDLVRPATSTNDLNVGLL